MFFLFWTLNSTHHTCLHTARFCSARETRNCPDRFNHTDQGCRPGAGQSAVSQDEEDHLSGSTKWSSQWASGRRWGLTWTLGSWHKSFYCCEVLYIKVFCVCRRWSMVPGVRVQWTAWAVTSLFLACLSVPVLKAVLSTAWQKLQMTRVTWTWWRGTTQSCRIAPSYISNLYVYVFFCSAPNTQCLVPFKAYT